jgi:hypothetical protein
LSKPPGSGRQEAFGGNGSTMVRRCPARGVKVGHDAMTKLREERQKRMQVSRGPVHKLRIVCVPNRISSVD